MYSQWAVDTELQPTQGYALSGKSVYVVTIYHQLHCIVSCLSSEPGSFRTNIDGDVARPRSALVSTSYTTDASSTTHGATSPIAWTRCFRRCNAWRTHLSAALMRSTSVEIAKHWRLERTRRDIRTIWISTWTNKYEY